MYCPVCGGHNGDFAVRCRRCGQILPGNTPSVSAEPKVRWTKLTSLFAGTTLVSTLILVGIVGLVMHRGLWGNLLSPKVESRAASIASYARRSISPMSTPVVPRPIHPTSLAVGDIGTSGPWKLAVDRAEFSPDQIANGWYQVVVTYTVMNTSDRTMNLDIPSTAASDSAVGKSATRSAGFLPMPVILQQQGTMGTGLSLFLLDGGGRGFGGGFGPSGGGYEFFAAPGAAIRLNYRFRYPGSSSAPFVLRAIFAKAAGGGRFDIHLDKVRSSPAHLVPSSTTKRTPEGVATTIGNEWAVTCEGVAFGPQPRAGERPVTVHLNVENLTNTARAALTDSSDIHGTLRDFYLTDDKGRVAYSHNDNLPGVVIPAHQSRDITIQLYTLNLASTADPLYFTAVVDWRKNLSAQFRLGQQQVGRATPTVSR